MSKRIFLFALLFSIFNMGWKWDTFSIRKTRKPAFPVQTLWIADMLESRKVRPRLINNSPPLIAKDLVIQGSPVEGVKAWTKKEGKWVWSFPVKSGVASPMALYKGNVYFGGRDGFFYSLKMETGDLNWKFFTDSENSGAPLIYEDKLYWSTNSQKLYALSLEGRRLWIYPGPSLSRDFVVLGRPQPVIYKNLIYMGFSDGSLVALNKDTGALQWERKLSAAGRPIREALKVEEPCLFAPLFDEYMFCLEPLSGRAIWKIKGGASLFYSKQNSVFYQVYEDHLYAVHKKNGHTLWKKKIAGYPFSPRVLGKYLVYGFPSQGHLMFVDKSNGKSLGKYQFGKGLSGPVSLDSEKVFLQGDSFHSLSGPVSLDSEKGAIYFLSIEGYLHKISINKQLLNAKKKL